MNAKWGLYEHDENGPIYDIKIDKHRQIGMASIEVYAELIGLSNYLSEKDVELGESLKTVALEMRHFVVGNTSRSIIRFQNALDYVLSHYNDTFPAYTIDLVRLCERIVNAIESGEEFIDDLLAVCAELEIYTPEGLDNDFYDKDLDKMEA